MTSTTPFSFTSTSTSTATPTCTSVTPDENGYVPYGACGSSYFYYPSFGAAIFFAVAFGLSFLTHIFQAFYHKKWKFCWVVIMGVTWEFAAFIIRTLSTRDQQNDALQIISTFLILLAPMWINAFVYMVMGRMIYFFVPNQEIWGVKAIKIAKIFVWLDIVAFIVQVAGGVLINPETEYKVMMTGIHVYMAGIGLQQLFILIFTAISIKFHLTMRQYSQSREIMSDTRKSQDWRWLLYALYATLALITTRVMFRMAEFSSGVEPEDNPIPAHEAYFLVLDALPVLVACVTLNAVHPGRILRGEGSEFPKGPSRKEKKAMKKAKKEEKLRIKQEKKGYKIGRNIDDDVELGTVRGI